MNLPPPDPDPDLSSTAAPPPARPPSPGFLRRNRVYILIGGLFFLACGIARFLWWFFLLRKAVPE